jgi:hypothetical protein
MRVRNLWFDLGGFIVFVMMLFSASYYVLDYLENKSETIFTTILFAGGYFFLALMFLWLSLFVGKLQRKRNHYKNDLAYKRYEERMGQIATNSRQEQ